MATNSPLSISKETPHNACVITPSLSYSLHKLRIKLQEVILSNQATRDQLDGRLNRIGQPSPMIRDVTIHAGILTYIHRRYEEARSLAEALRGFAEDIGLKDKTLLKSLI